MRLPSSSSLRREVLEALTSLKDVAVKRSIVKLGFVSDVNVDSEAGSVAVTLTLPSLAHQGKDHLISGAKQALAGLGWVKEANVGVIAGPTKTRPSPAASTGLKRVSHVVAVSSCKGGVGKSTVAVNLAYALVAEGARVGLLDADVYGPSLPALISPEDKTLRTSHASVGKPLLLPISHRGLRCLSFGFVNPGAGLAGAGGEDAAVLRGPIVSKVITQLLLGTDWGELDYLVVDMPPGTGDIQITLSQNCHLSGTVIVTTPQKLSYIDVVKGVNMFEGLKVPALALVENMSYFTCKHGERHEPFGKGYVDELSQQFDFAAAFRLPLSASTAIANDSGVPLMLQQNTASKESESASEGEGEVEREVYTKLAQAVVADLFGREHNQKMPPRVSYVKSRGLVLRVMTETDATELVMPARELRIRDPQTGAPLEPELVEEVPDHVEPATIDVKGNYGVGIDWSDGHRGSIYTYEVLQSVFAEATK